MTLLCISDVAVGVCYGSRSGRPLGDHSAVTSITDCIAHSMGYKYFALGCPSGNGYECWRGNDISGDAIALDMSDCTGTPLTDIGNGADNGGCSGYPTGTFTVDYNGVAVPLGGWHREPVYDRADFMSTTDTRAYISQPACVCLYWELLCLCIHVCVHYSAAVHVRSRRLIMLLFKFLLH